MVTAIKGAFQRTSAGTYLVPNYGQQPAQQLMQVLEQEVYTRYNRTIKRSKNSFSEATDRRGLLQFLPAYQDLKAQASENRAKQDTDLLECSHSEHLRLNIKLS